VLACAIDLRAWTGYWGLSPSPPYPLLRPFNSCNEDKITDPEKLKAHTDQMRKRMQLMADYTGREIWAYPEETRGMMIPKGEGASTWLKVKPK
jgi:hypothetical protein